MEIRQLKNILVCCTLRPCPNCKNTDVANDVNSMTLSGAFGKCGEKKVQPDTTNKMQKQSIILNNCILSTPQTGIKHRTLDKNKLQRGKRVQHMKPEKSSCGGDEASCEKEEDKHVPFQTQEARSVRLEIVPCLDWAHAGQHGGSKEYRDVVAWGLEGMIIVVYIDTRER